MLKFNSIIKNLSIHQKIELLTSSNLSGNEALEYYELPVFSVTADHNAEDNKYVYPSVHTLARSFNEEYIRAVSYLATVEGIKKNKGLICGASVDSSDRENAMSENAYLNGKLASAYLKGVDDADGMTTVFGVKEKDYEDENKYFASDLLSAEIALKEASPKLVLTKDEESSEIIRDTWGYDKFLAFAAQGDLEIVRGFFRKNQLLLTENENANELIEKAIMAYSDKKKELYEGNLSKMEFDELLREGVIFDGKLLDGMVDRYLDFLSQFETLGNQKKTLNFDLSKLFYDITIQSAVLLKNENQLLPILPGNPISVVGQYAKVDAAGNVSEDENAETFFRHIGAYDIAHNGFAHGYLSDTELNGILIDEARELCQKTGKVLLFLGTENETDTELPVTQMKLLDALYKDGIKIAAVVRAGDNLDFAFANKCNSVLFVGFNGDNGKSVCDLVVGNATPSARITKDLLGNVTTVVDEQEVSEKQVIFPIGTGYSYEQLEYSSFKVTEKGVSYIVRNTGNIDNRCVTLLTVRKLDGNGIFEKSTVRAFSFTPILYKEALKVEIPFDAYTFRYYDTEKKCFGIAGGEYEVALDIGGGNAPLTAKISLKQSYEKDVFESRFEKEYSCENEAVGALVNTKEHKKEKELYSPMEAKKKTTILLLFALYFNVIFGILLGFIIMSMTRKNPMLIPLVSVIAVLAAVDISTLIILIVDAKHRRRFKLDNINIDLSHVVDKMNLYSVSNREIFDVPNEWESVKTQIAEEDTIPEPEPEPETEIVDVAPDQESLAEEIKEAEEKAKEINDSDYIFENADDAFEDLTQFDNAIHIEELTASFCDYCLKNKVVIEPAAARALLAATVSTNLLFLRATDMECLPAVLESLCGFFGNKPFMKTIDDSVATFHNLIWQPNEEGMYERTDFVSFLNGAKKFKKHLNICVLDKVNCENLKNYFLDFMQFAVSPTLDHSINLGTKTHPLMFELPKNVLYILVPDNEDYLDTLPREYSRASLNLNLSVRKAAGELKTELVETATVSLDAVRELLHTEKNNCFLGEDDWKKFDEFENNMKSLDSKYAINNKSVLMLEKYSTFILALGADSIEACDTFLANHFVPMMKSTKLYNLPKGDMQIRKVMEKAFGAENLTYTLRAMKKKEQ